MDMPGMMSDDDMAAMDKASGAQFDQMFLTAMIEHIFGEHHARYGYRRIHAVLARRGDHCSPELVRALMRAAGLVTCHPRQARMRTTRQGEKCAPIPDLVGRDFTASAPGQILVGDITYVRTWQGWLYVALVIDCYSRKIVGWAMDDHYRTPLITAAIAMAARNLRLPHGAVFHSDRGSNYTSEEYAKALTAIGLRQSVGRTGICFDNALAESTNGALKVELVNRKQYATRDAAKRDIANYIELFYNRQRLHPLLGYPTPQEVLDSYRESPKAA